MRGGIPGLTGSEQLDHLGRRDFTEAERQTLARQGKALPDGSFPIVTVADLTNAIRALGRAKDPSAAKAHIVKRARALGRVDLLPASWGIKRSALAANDTDSLRAALRGINATAPKDYEAMERKLLEEQAPRRERERQALVADEGWRRFAEYARLVG